MEQIHKSSQKVKEWIITANFQPQFEKDITSFYEELKKEHSSNNFAVAIRSSATAEDLKYASFAGQLETFLFIKGIQNVLLAIKKIYASLYNPRAIGYRLDMGLGHEKLLLLLVYSA